MSLFNELKRRNVFKVAIAYIVVTWFVLQVADVVLNNITAPGWVFKVLMLFLAIGFPFAVIFAWAFEMTPEGLKRESEVDRSQSIPHETGQKLTSAMSRYPNRVVRRAQTTDGVSPFLAVSDGRSFYNRQFLDSRFRVKSRRLQTMNFRYE